MRGVSSDAHPADQAEALLPQPEAGAPAADFLRRLSSLTILHFCRNDEPLHLPGMRPEEILRRVRAFVDRSPFLWLLQSALLHPEKLALVDAPSPSGASQTLNYSQLLLRSVSLCEGLGRLGCLRGSRIAVLLHNCGSVMDVHFTASAIGATVVNLNTHLVSRELCGLLASSAPQFIVTSADRAAVLCDALLDVPSLDYDLSAVTILWVGGTPAAAAQLPVRSLDYESLLLEHRISDARQLGDTLYRLPPAASASPFQIYFTSGTTGKPKPVVLSLSVVVTHALGTVHEMRLHSEDVWLHVAPMFHLVDAFALYAVTRVGGRHVVTPSFAPAETLMLIEQARRAPSPRRSCPPLSLSLGAHTIPHSGTCFLFERGVNHGASLREQPYRSARGHVHPADF